MRASLPRIALIALSALFGLLTGYLLAKGSDMISTAPLDRLLLPRLQAIGHWLGSAEGVERLVQACYLLWRSAPIALAGGLLCGPLLAHGLHARAFCYAVLIWPLYLDWTIWWVVDHVGGVARDPLFEGRPLPGAAVRHDFLAIALEQFALYSLFLLIAWLVARHVRRRAGPGT